MARIFSNYPKIITGETVQEAKCTTEPVLKFAARRMLRFYGTGAIKNSYMNGFGFSHKCQDRAWIHLILKFKITWIILALMVFIPLLGLYYIFALVMRGCCYRHSCELRFQRILRRYLTVLMLICIVLMLLAYVILVMSTIKLIEMKGGSHTFLFHYFEGVGQQINYVLETNYDEFAMDFADRARKIITEFTEEMQSGGYDTSDVTDDDGGGGVGSGTTSGLPNGQGPVGHPNENGKLPNDAVGDSAAPSGDGNDGAGDHNVEAGAGASGDGKDGANTTIQQDPKNGAVTTGARTLNQHDRYRHLNTRKKHRKSNENDWPTQLSRAIDETRSNTTLLRAQIAMLTDYLRFIHRNTSLYLLWHPMGMKTIEKAGLIGLEQRSIKPRDVDNIDNSVNVVDNMVSELKEVRRLAKKEQIIFQREHIKSFHTLKSSLNTFFTLYRKKQMEKANNIDDKLWETYLEFQKYERFKLPDEIWKSGCFLTAVIGVILFLLILGVIFGHFGKRTYYSMPGFNKETGGKILILTILLILVTYPILCAIALSHFFFGVITHNGICSKTYINYLIYGQEKQTNTPNMYHKCLDTETIFGKMVAESYVFYPEIANGADFNKTIDVLSTSLYQITESLVPVGEGTNRIDRMIKQVSHFRRSNTCKDIRAQLQLAHLQNVTETLKEYLRKSEVIPDNEFPNWGPQIKNRLQCTVEFLDQQVINDHIRGRMYDQFDAIEHQCDKLKSQFSGGVEHSVRRYFIKGEQKMRKISTLQKRKTDALCNRLKEEYTRSIMAYNEYMTKALGEQIGRCAFISQDQKSLINLKCDCLTYPLNGHWASAFAILLFLLPATVIAMTLANLYRKSCVDYARRRPISKSRPARRPDPVPKHPRVPRVHMATLVEEAAIIIPATTVEKVNSDISLEVVDVDADDDVPDGNCRCLGTLREELKMKVKRDKTLRK